MRTIMAALLVAFTLSGCGLEDTTAPQNEVVYHGFLEFGTGFSGVTGEAALAWVEGQDFYQAAVLLVGEEPGTVRAWRLHFGTCQQDEGVVGVASEYPPLVAGADRNSFIRAVIPLQFDRNRRYHVRVHPSQQQLDRLMACANLTLQP